MKRVMPRAKGRADRILKRTSHITVVVSDRYLGRGIAMGQKVNPNGIRLGIVNLGTLLGSRIHKISPTILTVTSKYCKF